MKSIDRRNLSRHLPLRSKAESFAAKLLVDSPHVQLVCLLVYLLACHHENMLTSLIDFRFSSLPTCNLANEHASKPCYLHTCKPADMQDLLSACQQAGCAL